ncbi:MAG: tetratricopeptide repeat protein [Betaproteobacteria bacterium]|nr:tetratricopeptide repeat protein [Betaproteobacteria bacterium]
MKRTILLALLAFPLTSLAAEESAWQKSYRLEYQQKFSEAAIALNPVDNGRDADLALMRKGWLAYQRARYGEAVEMYQKALEKNPASLEARQGVMLPLMAQQRWREVASYARKVIADSAWDYTAHTRLLVAEEAMRDWATLAAHAERLSEHYPGDATALVYLARAHAWMGNGKEAKDAYNRVLARYPGHIEASQYVAK